MEVRCPQHDHVFETETDHRKPGTRDLGEDKQTQSGRHSHPRYKGGVSGHPDCPLCKKAIASKDESLLPDDAPAKKDEGGSAPGKKDEPGKPAGKAA